MILYCRVTNTTGIISVQINNSHNAQTATAQIEAQTSTLSIGDRVEVYMGYTDNYDKIFTGYVKNVETKEPNKTISITAADAMARALDFFIAASDPDKPFKRKGIKAEKLVEDVMALASLTDYIGDVTYFTFGIHNDVEVNLTSSYDYGRFIADILAYNLYADINGQVHFTRRLPYVVTGDTSIGTITIAEATSMEFAKTDKDLRNRVVVYGADKVHAEAKAESPYLPSGFYKTVVVAAPTVFDDDDMAQQAANYNLQLLNRLTQSINVTIVGDPKYQPRLCTTVINESIGASGLWYIYSVTHSLSNSGYITSLNLRK